MDWKKILSSKLAVFCLLALVLLLGNVKFKQWQNEKEIQKQVDSLIAQKQEREKKNEELKQTVEYFSSNAFKEKVARQQLGYKKDGESVFGFSEDAQEIVAAPPVQQKIGNPEKWWDYFFNKN